MSHITVDDEQARIITEASGRIEVRYTRFVRQFYAGEGDHTVSRREFVDRMSAAELEELLRSRRAATGSADATR